MERRRIIAFLRGHPSTLSFFWKCLRASLTVMSPFIPVRDKTMLFASFGGRSFDDSPKAIYEEVLRRQEFDDWNLIWAFVDPEKHNIPKGNKIKIDTMEFFLALLYSKVWISNSGMDRNIGVNRRQTIKVETWHGTPIKKLGTDQKSGTLGNYRPKKQKDSRTIRCAQSEYDLEIFERIFNAARESFVLSDLPRNDALKNWTEEQRNEIKKRLGIEKKKKIILYMPTYREYLMDKENGYYFENPINVEKWEKTLGADYVILFRAHYAVTKALNISTSEFIVDVSEYPTLNDLYIAADLLISDYSSAFFDFSILEKPMLCYAFDYEEYREKRGLYISIEDELPCEINMTEDEVINCILEMDFDKASRATKAFHHKYTPNAGHASNIIVDTIEERLHSK